MRIVYIKLKKASGLHDNDYRVTQLKNAASVSVALPGKHERDLVVGDTVSQREAAHLCTNNRLEVTITD